MTSPTPLTELYACLDYCEQQNGRSDCKNCGLTREMIDALTTQHTKEKEELVREILETKIYAGQTDHSATGQNVYVVHESHIKAIAKKYNITLTNKQ